MTPNEARALVLSVYPEAYIHKYGVGRYSGTTYIIVAENTTLASKHRPYNSAWTAEAFERLIWWEAANYIMRKMIRKLEQ